MAKNPKSPHYSLSASLEYADLAYGAVGGNSVDVETFFNAMGYSGRSGASLSTIASLRYFGLVDGRAESVNLSELYMRITRPLSEKEKYEAILEASRSPKIYAEIHEEFKNLPPLDILTSIAVRKFGFSENGAKRFASNIIDTEAFVNSCKPDEVFDESPDEVERDSLPSDAPVNNNETHSSLKNSDSSPIQKTGKGCETLQFKLSRDVHAEVRIFGEVTDKAIKRLITHLELTADIYSDD